MDSSKRTFLLGTIGMVTSLPALSSLNKSVAKSCDIENDKTLSLEEYNVLSDGEDQASQFKSMLQKIENENYIIIDGKGATICISEGLEIDITKVGLKNINFKFIGEIIESTFILRVNGRSNDNTRNAKYMFKGISVEGPKARDKRPIFGYLINPDIDISGLTFDNCTAKNLQSAFVFGSNSYLINFNNCSARSCRIIFTDTKTIKYEEKITNAGENLNFNNGSYGNSDQIAKFTGYEFGANFNGVSFDYSGGKHRSNQWELLKQGITLNFNGCHFESGNENDGVNGNYFYTNKSINISLRDGRIIFPSTKLNNCEYFFYDSSNTSSFRLNGVRLFGMGILQWSNIVPDEFYPVVNYKSSEVTSKISDGSKFLIDPKFTQARVLDDWTISYQEKNKNSKITELEFLTEGESKYLSFKAKDKINNISLELNTIKPSNAYIPSIRLKFSCFLKKEMRIDIYLFNNVKCNSTENHAQSLKKISSKQINLINDDQDIIFTYGDKLRLDKSIISFNNLKICLLIPEMDPDDYIKISSISIDCPF